MSERRWQHRVAGPALLLAVGISALVVSRQPPPPRPRTLDAPVSPIGLVPEPGWLVRRGAEIPLTAAQMARARALSAAWDRETVATRDALARMGAALDRQQHLDAALQNQFGAASRRLAERRHAAWDEVWTTLSAAQRQRVRDLRAAARLEMR